MAHQEQYSQSMGPPQSPPIPIDPQLSMYPSYYPGNYQQTTPQHLQHLTLPPNYSSPSSQGSEYMGTPPADHAQPSSSNGKRPASVVSNGTPDENRKRPRKDDESEHGAEAGKDEPTKVKSTRGSRACTVCRRLKMKCVGAEQGGPCKRCQAGGHACIFEESNRGKRSSKKHEILTRSLRKMERTLDTVLKSIGNPSIVSGMVSRSPSPSNPISTTSALIAASPESPTMSQSPSFQNPQPGSPKLHSLPDNTLNPLGLLAEASLANRRNQGTNSPLMGRSTEDENQPKIGVASDNYFKPGPMTILPLRRLFIERQIQPEMLTFVTTEEVVSLFNIFFDNISMHCNLLDRNFHTPSLVCSRSPFLLTTICSIASKFYTPKPELHTRLTELAKKLAFSVPAQGYKSVEIVQAYLLLTLWGCGAVERYEQDKTWLLLGMAIRMATDLNLHRKTAVSSEGTQEGKARDMEVHNRERTWILCYCLDRSLSAQMGKPHSIKEDAIIRNASKWCHGAMASTTDPSLTAYCELQRILSRCLDFLYSGTETSSGLQQHCDYMLTIKTFEAQVNGWLETWVADRRWPVVQGEPRIIEYKKLISQFYYNYAMLVLNSFGLQNAMENSPVDLGHFFARCHTSATICATLVRDSLGPKGFMRYAPDSHFVMTSYAVVSLLKLVRPEFQVFMDNEQKTLHLVQDTANTLEQVAVNSSHTPALYSAFIRALLTAKIDANRESSLPNNVNGDPTLAADNLPYPDVRQSQADAYNAQPPHYGTDLLLNGFQFESEMGPVADITTFPPTMAPAPSEDSMGSLTMDNILSSGFWDSVLVPGYNSMDGLTGGFLFGVGGSGLITPRMGLSPMQSGNNTPARGGSQNSLTQSSINAAFSNQLKNEGISSDS